MTGGGSIDAFDGGWDSAATLVDGRWVDRTPRRPEVAPRLRMEARLMGWLAPQLPLDVPRPFVRSADPLVVRHALVEGEELELPAGAVAHGAALGAFLRALHAVDVGEAVAHGAPPADAAARSLGEELARMRDVVLPLLPSEPRAAGRALLDAAATPPPAAALVHGDLGPEHLLVRDDVLAGVIDWSDAHVGDPAIDLAWALHGTPPTFADALAAAYGGAPALRERALLWHRLGPWYEVVHGVETTCAETVRSGLDGVLARL